ncbi:hypothetical protein AAF712_013999 [Marasmius tenuissimus]|uniref:Nudix hydrolase domain-containing protein n=1 Tax=Marasmius tenuissimus TaxID=585030 RepID=A0ABR2ZE85_9AGAR
MNSHSGSMGQKLSQQRRSLPHTRPAYQFSEFSSRPIPHAGFGVGDFMLGAGMVGIQPSTQKVVIIEDKRSNRWLLPRGRKDVGESLEETALREAFEETGYKVDFLPMYTGTLQPYAPKDRLGPYPPKNTEPIFMNIIGWKARYDLQGRVKDRGGEYFVSWYVGQIPEDAVRHEGVCMPDEQEYVSHIVTFEDAWKKLSSEDESRVLHRAWTCYLQHLDVQKEVDESIRSGENQVEEQLGNLTL